MLLTEQNIRTVVKGTQGNTSGTQGDTATALALALALVPMYYTLLNSAPALALAKPSQAKSSTN